jgi:two-component system, chemotaxis family, chemotaxis protein CheY
MKILVVDDSLVMRKIVSSTVAVVGAEPVHAGDGQAALEQLERDPENWQMITLDWNMPRMDGLTFLKTLRGHPRFADLPVLMLTTEGNKQAVIDAVRAGANSYLIKPFTAQDLQIKIMDCLGLAT